MSTGDIFKPQMIFSKCLATIQRHAYFMHIPEKESVKIILLNNWALI
jgi:hypothetical protein